MLIRGERGIDIGLCYWLSFDHIVVFLKLTSVIISLSAGHSHHFPICEEFLKTCDTELKKVNLFFSGSSLRKFSIAFVLMFSGVNYVTELYHCLRKAI